MSRKFTFALALLTSALTSVAIIVSLWAVGIVGAGPGLLPSLQGGAPTVVNYQGRLTDPSTGQAKADGSYDMVFRVYDAETGGSSLWTGTRTAANGNAITVTRGLFSVLLGSGAGNSLSASLFSGTSRWIEMRVGSETLSPRQRIGSVPYALQAEEAKNAATLSGQGPSAFVGQGQANSITTTMLITGAVTSNALAASAVGTSAIADVAVTSGKLATGAVTSTALADSSVTSAKIADSAVTSGKLATGAVTSTALASAAITNTHIRASAAISPTKLAFYGDGSAGALNVTTTTSLTGNNNFTDCTIQSGVTFDVEAGSIIRCTGNFTNNGTIIVIDSGIKNAITVALLRAFVYCILCAFHYNTGAQTGRIDFSLTTNQILPRIVIPGAGDARGPAGLPEGGTGGMEVEGGDGGPALAGNEISVWHLFKVGGGGGTSRTGGAGPSTGGGLLRVMAKGAIVNAGTIQANGSSMTADGGGGGGGGIVILASSTAVTNTGTIEAKGGGGGPSDNTAGAGGGGGLVMFIAPIVSNTGTTSVTGGAAGTLGAANSVTADPAAAAAVVEGLRGSEAVAARFQVQRAAEPPGFSPRRAASAG